MKCKILILALLNILSVSIYSQIIFESGYFIDESNHKTECLINNIDWRNNPTEFEYKISPNEAIQKATIQTVKEFGINGISKYIRALVQIDRSSAEIDKMSSGKNPIFKEEQLFLKVLIEGKASLFHYIDGNLIRFFYKVNDSEINQLVYKSYLINNSIAQNYFFRQQLFLELKCEEITLNDLKNISYNPKDFKQLFEKYNKCTNSIHVNYEPTQKRDLFNLSLRLGLNSNKLRIANLDGRAWDINFGNTMSVRQSIEAEFILPFNKNTWSLLIEPTYSYYKSEKKIETESVNGGILISRAKYHNIELPVGVRHYFYSNNNSKYFVNAFIKFNFTKNSTVEFKNSDGVLLSVLRIMPRNNLAIGFGYKYKDRYSLEVRYHTKLAIFTDYMYWVSRYRTISIIFGYSIF